jgi:hypothetical protein
VRGRRFPAHARHFEWCTVGLGTITGGDNASGYSYEHTTIEGFNFLRISGVGWFGDFGNLLVMSTTGPFKAASGRPQNPGAVWRGTSRLYADGVASQEVLWRSRDPSCCGLPSQTSPRKLILQTLGIGNRTTVVFQ